jgi:hypothetical protein
VRRKQPPLSFFLEDGPTERGRTALALLDQESEDYDEPVGRTLYRLGEWLPGQVTTPGDDGYAAATAIWSKPAGRMPDAVVHCQTPLGLRTQEMLRTSTLLAEPSALAPTRLWESPPSTT